MIERPTPQGEEVVADAEAGVVRCSHRRVAIVGAGLDRLRAPYGDPAWCVWALNEIWQPAFTRHWEMHPMRVQSLLDLAALAKIQEPCYVLDLETSREFVPNPVRYPLERALALAGRRYFTCTFAYQLALVALEGFEEVGLWGVQLYWGTPRERLVEAACTEYWLGFLQGRGVRVTQDSDLARQDQLYGYDYDSEVRAVNGQVADLRHVMDEMDRRRGVEHVAVRHPGLSG